MRAFVILGLALLSLAGAPACAPPADSGPPAIDVARGRAPSAAPAPPARAAWSETARPLRGDAGAPGAEEPAPDLPGRRPVVVAAPPPAVLDP